MQAESSFVCHSRQALKRVTFNESCPLKAQWPILARVTNIAFDYASRSRSGFGEILKLISRYSFSFFFFYLIKEGDGEKIFERNNQTLEVDGIWCRYNLLLLQ